jgi:hypothetical protein
VLAAFGFPGSMILQDHPPLEQFQLTSDRKTILKPMKLLAFESGAHRQQPMMLE